jgi:hypothetical protein
MEGWLGRPLVSPTDPPSSAAPGVPGIPKGFPVAAVLAGIVTAVNIAGMVSIPEPSTPQNQLSVFDAHKAAIAFSDLWFLVFALGVTPFITCLAAALRSQNRGIVWAGVFVFLFGAYTLAISNAASYSALFAISSTAAPSSATATYEAALWYNITDGWEVLGFTAVGVGVALLSVTLWDSKIYPNWMAVLGILGGLIGAVGGASTAWIFTGGTIPGVVFPLILGSFVAIVVWGFASPVAVKRRAASGTVPG